MTITYTGTNFSRTKVDEDGTKCDSQTTDANGMKTMVCRCTLGMVNTLVNWRCAIVVSGVRDIKATGKFEAKNSAKGSFTFDL